MKDKLSVVFQAVLDRNAGFDHEGHEQPQVVVRPRAGSDTVVGLWAMPEYVVVPAGEEIAIRFSFIADGQAEIIVERWTRYGTT